MRPIREEVLARTPRHALLRCVICRRALALALALAVPRVLAVVAGQPYMEADTMEGDLDAACAAYQNALIHRENYPEVYNNLGTLLASLGRVDQAEHALRKAIHQNPGYLDAHNNLAGFYAGEGRDLDALRALGDALRLAPEDRRALVLTGRVQLRRGHFEPAEQACRIVLARAPGDVEAMVAKTVESFGRLDMAVNAAGVGGPSQTPIADIEEADWDAVLDTNLKAVWRCMKYEIRAMLACGGGGSIVNVSSIYGYKPSDVGHAPYCAAKHGVIGLSKTAAIDYADKGIRVNVVCPGLFHSEMVDPYLDVAPDFISSLTLRHSTMNRLGEAHEIAEAIAWLCSDASSFVNGASLTLDGGDTTRL